MMNLDEKIEKMIDWVGKLEDRIETLESQLDEIVKDTLETMSDLDDRIHALEHDDADLVRRVERLEKRHGQV